MTEANKYGSSFIEDKGSLYVKDSEGTTRIKFLRFQTPTKEVPEQKKVSEGTPAKQSELLRYNRGFGKLGPLEQCSDGELCYYKDHLADKNATVDAVRAYWLDRNKQDVKEIFDLRSELRRVNKCLGIVSCTLGVLAAVTIYRIFF